MPRHVAALLFGVVVLAAIPLARAHVQPGVDVNNRYIKLTPSGNHVRLVYTVYMGEIPGAQTRKRLDTNGDGALSEKETEPFAAEIATGVRGKLEVTIDGTKVPVTWSDKEVGLGEPVVAGGAFSIDLIAYLCVAEPNRAAHQVVLFDHYRVPTPGETEVKIEESPGIKVTSATLGGRGQTMLDMKWAIVPSPAETDGIFVKYEVDPSMVDVSGRPGCEPGAPKTTAAAGSGESAGGGGRTTLYAVVAGAVLVVAALGLVLLRRRKAS